MNIYLVDGMHISLQAEAAKRGHKVFVWARNAPMMDPEQFRVVEIKPKNVVQVGSVVELFDMAVKDKGEKLVITDNADAVAEYELACAMGLKPIGWDQRALLLESNRVYGNRVFAEISRGTCAQSMSQQAFSDPEKLLKAMKSKSWANRMYVIKVAPESPPPAVYGPTTLIVNSRSAREHAIAEMSRRAPTGEINNRWFAKGQGGCVVEDFAMGSEIAFSRYFNGERFVGPTLANSEQKDVTDGNRSGILSGEVGSTLQPMYLKDKCDVGVLWSRLSDVLAGHGRGMVDMNFIWNPSDGTLNFIEFTIRFGRPTLETQLLVYPDFFRALHRNNVVESITINELPDSKYNPSASIAAAAVTVFQYGYPLLHEMPNAPDHMQALRFQLPKDCTELVQTEDGIEHVPVKFVPLFSHYDSSLGCWEQYKFDGRAFVAVGLGTTTKTSGLAVQEALKYVRIQQATWRTDVGLTQDATVKHLLDACVLEVMQ